MQNRFKEIRTFHKETQASFAKVLNVSKSTIEAIEYGRREPTDRTISDVCRVFGINEDWLRTGEGEMKKPLSREAEIAEIATSIFKGDDSTFRFQLQKAIAELPEDTLEKAYDFVAKLVDNVRANKKDS